MQTVEWREVLHEQSFRSIQAEIPTYKFRKKRNLTMNQARKKLHECWLGRQPGKA